LKIDNALGETRGCIANFGMLERKTTVHEKIAESQLDYRLVRFDGLSMQSKAALHETELQTRRQGCRLATDQLGYAIGRFLEAPLLHSFGYGLLSVGKFLLSRFSASPRDFATLVLCEGCLAFITTSKPVTRSEISLDIGSPSFRSVSDRRKVRAFQRDARPNLVVMEIATKG